MTQANYPAGWLQSEPYQPQDHLSKARANSTKEDYLAVAQRLVWFVSEQRQMIASGVATCSFVVQSKIVELDSAGGSCTCEAYIRDCLGNEASDIGTETRADFKDFAEKAATKAKGRALASLGYGTQFAPELDEGERIADAPKEQRQPAQKPVAAPAKPTPIKQEPKQDDPAKPKTRGEALKARAAALGWIGTAYTELVTQATGRSLEYLKEHGALKDDLDKIEDRVALLEKAAKAEAQKAQAKAS